MTLFNYEHCKKCKKCNNDIKIELSKVLPVNVCNNICEYNVNCSKCKTLLKREDEFFKNRTGGVMPLIEKQIFFISSWEYKLFCYIPSGQGLIVMKKQIDFIFDDQKVKEKYFKNKMLLQATKSWAKRDIHIVQDINRMIADVSNLRRKIRWFIEDRVFEFRKKTLI